jgi:hypothetical protein
MHCWPWLQFLTRHTLSCSSDVGFMSIAVGDFNGDGIPDIAAVNSNAMTVTIRLGNGEF